MEKTELNNHKKQLKQEIEIQDECEVLAKFENENKIEFIVEEEKKINWKKEQEEAIIDRNKNLLVSASAGSGKTAVMTQRIVDLVVEGTPISKFLIVTFTNASAQEMKTRIVSKLLKLPQNEYILEQIDSIPTCDISDLHSFYSRLISTYFYEVEIDPSYHIIDDVESAYFKDKAISRLFEQKEKSGDERYYKLFDFFQKKRQDESLRKIVFEFNNFLDSHIDGDKWFEETIQKTYDLNIEENICSKIIVEYVIQRTEILIKKAENFAKKAVSVGCEGYYNYFIDLISNLKAFSLKKSFIENANIAMSFEFKSLPKSKEEFKFLTEEAKTINEKIKKDVLKFKDNFVSNSKEDLVNILVNVKEML